LSNYQCAICFAAFKAWCQVNNHLILAHAKKYGGEEFILRIKKNAGFCEECKIYTTLNNGLCGHCANGTREQFINNIWEIDMQPTHKVIKEKFAELKATLDAHNNRDGGEVKDKRAMAVAITHLETGSMWAVRSFFSDEERAKN
jgi:hypothetical protein